MGGGTLLIPLLTIFAGQEQHIAQSINLIAFIPMSIIAIIIHAKNKLIDFSYLIKISLPATVASVLAVMIVKNIDAKHLKVYFGIFLIILAIYQIACMIIKKIMQKINKKKEEKMSYTGA